MKIQDVITEDRYEDAYRQQWQQFQPDGEEQRAGMVLRWQQVRPNRVLVQALSGDGSRELGSVQFHRYDPSSPKWTGEALHVDERYRRQGVATAMYDWFRQKFGPIRPSDAQTRDGESFWQRKKVWEQAVAEGVPQPGKSSGKPISWISPDKVITKYLTLDEILNSIQGIPYYNEVVKDRDAKDFTWGVTKKVIEYAKELIVRPDAYKNWPPIIVVDGKLQDGAHRISTINLMQKRVQPNNPIWKNAKLKVEFGKSDNVRQDVREGRRRCDDGIEVMPEMG